MCLIAVIPSRVEPSAVEGALRRIGISWDTNNDGAGFAFADGGAVTVRKPFYGKKQLLRALRRAIYKRALGKSDLVVHLRWATHGSLARENVHPHVVGADRKVVIAHNGVLSGFGSKKSGEGESDTVEFLRTFYSESTAEEILHPKGLRALGIHAGSYNKFAALGPDGIARIVNETAGYWREGVWYSAWVAETVSTRSTSRYGNDSFYGDGCGWGGRYASYDWKPYQGSRVASKAEPERETIVLRPKLELVTKGEAESIARIEAARQTLAASGKLPPSEEAGARLNALIDQGSGEIAPDVARALIEESERRRNEFLADEKARHERITRAIERYHESKRSKYAPFLSAPAPAPAAPEAETEDPPLDYSGVPQAEQGVAPATPEGPRTIVQVGCPAAACERTESTK